MLNGFYFFIMVCMIFREFLCVGFLNKVKSTEQIIVVPIKKIHTQTVSTPMTLRHTFFFKYVHIFVYTLSRRLKKKQYGYG
jgi:hypothetical protein